MFGHSQPLNLHNQIPSVPDDEEDGAASDGMDNTHMRFDSHALKDGAGAVGEDVASDGLYVSSAGGMELVAQRGDGTSQLSLSFRGQVYVFDAVTPDKVQAVLLLLGGYELSTTQQGVEMTHQNLRSVMDIPRRCSQPQRAASLNRFRQKRNERCFDKKVRYSVRQEVALRMQRNKGQFTSAKRPDGTHSWDTVQGLGQVESHAETLCTHCGTSSKGTPMMRRGPSGPRSLCNACGLFWANRGTLRDLSKRNQDHPLSFPEEKMVVLNHILVKDGRPQISLTFTDSGTPSHGQKYLVPFTNTDDSAQMVVR